ncbi:MAG: hypothetical protein ACRD35_08680 [Candidatus Acidiferrales bacterium]
MGRAHQLPALPEEWFNLRAILPYGLKVAQVKAAMRDALEFLYKTNSFLLAEGYKRLEDFMPGNAFSGLVSEVLVQAIPKHCPHLTKNLRVGGHPDLIPKGHYRGDTILRGDEGVDIKSSKQAGGWQGHNPEEGWVMVFRCQVDTGTEPTRSRKSFQFVEVLAARLTRRDWSFSGRRETSRRTITASMKREAVERLRSNCLYRNPAYAVRRRTSHR